MRLLRSVERMEAGAARATAARRSRAQRVGLVWTADDVRLSAEQVAALAPGEHVALDLYQMGRCDGTEQARTVERVTTDAQDLGIVYDEGESRIGHVIEISGGLVSWRYDPPPAA